MLGVIITALLGMLLMSDWLYGTSAGRAVGRAASRRLVRMRILKLDAMRHRIPAKPLAKTRTVHRYTTQGMAQQELRVGIAPGRHMTATAPPGRPMSAQTAKGHYGLLRQPTVRETIRLPKGLPVRHSHAINAARGVGELTSPKRVPPEAIKKVVRLRK